MLQLVASRRGVAALPRWSVQGYLERGYVQAKPITAQGLTSELYAVLHSERASAAYLTDFVDTMRTVSVQNLPDVVLL